MKKCKSAFLWLLLSVLILLLDQWTKHWMLGHLSDQHVVSVLPFLNFVLRFNAGAAFSFLGDMGGWQVAALSAISIIVSVLLVNWLWRLDHSDWATALPISLILGGAIGNVIDRVRFGVVTDFIDFHVGAWHFATFNIADSAVSVGAVLLVLRLLYEAITRKS